jgi:phage-related protein
MATKKKLATKRKRAAKKKPVAKRKSAAKKKPTTRKPTAKKSTATRAATRTLVAGGSVRDGVVSLLANQLRVSKAEADGKAIRGLVAACGPDTQSLVASAINHDWSGLSRQFRQADVSCDDTADTLAEEITNRMS